MLGLVGSSAFAVSVEKLDVVNYDAVISEGCKEYACDIGVDLINLEKEDHSDFILKSLHKNIENMSKLWYNVNNS